MTHRIIGQVKLANCETRSPTITACYIFSVWFEFCGGFRDAGVTAYVLRTSTFLLPSRTQEEKGVARQPSLVFCLVGPSPSHLSPCQCSAQSVTWVIYLVGVKAMKPVEL